MISGSKKSYGVALSLEQLAGEHFQELESVLKSIKLNGGI